MEKSLNLNELVFPQSFGSLSKIVKSVEEKTGDSYSRVHVGSNFCSQYFLKLANFYLNNPEVFDVDLPVTLTIPIVSQKDLKASKETVLKLMDTVGNIDEVTVNDLGMLYFLKDKYPINLGRLFFKDVRDFRVEEYSLLENFPNMSEFIPDDSSIKGVEVDNISEKLDLGRFPENLTVSIHYPYTYQSTGNICKFASINKPVESKFRPNDNCGLDCSGIYEHYRELFGEKENIDDNLTDIFRQGRTVYFYNDNVQYTTRQPDRMVYFPLREVVNRRDEDFNTI